MTSERYLAQPFFPDPSVAPISVPLRCLLQQPEARYYSSVPISSRLAAKEKMSFRLYSEFIIKQQLTTTRLFNATKHQVMISWNWSYDHVRKSLVWPVFKKCARFISASRCSHDIRSSHYTLEPAGSQSMATSSTACNGVCLTAATSEAQWQAGVNTCPKESKVYGAAITCSALPHRK